VGHIGTYKARALSDFLVRVVRKTSASAPDTRFVLVGGGPELGYIRATAEDLLHDGRAALTGHVPHEEVPQQVRETDVCLLFLTTDFPFSLIDQSRSSTKLFEYMAYGKAIVSSNVGEPKHILENGVDALLVENTAEAFAEAILKLKGDPGLRKRLQTNAREKFLANYTHEILMGKLLTWVATLR
jgi:glycosyltransferase involved in cell wall biosynthesis